MTIEKIIDAIGMIDDDIIVDAKKNKRPIMSLWLKRSVAVAACLCLIASLGIFASHSFNISSSLINDIDNIESVGGDPQEWGGNSEELILDLLVVQVDDLEVVYSFREEESKNQTELKEKIGEVYEESESRTLYKLNGYDNIKYLISLTHDTDSEGVEEYQLWEFNLILYDDSQYITEDDETYQLYPSNAKYFSVILEKIFNVASADDIQNITTSPLQDDYSEDAQIAQSVVGTHTYEDREFINLFYNTISNMNDQEGYSVVLIPESEDYVSYEEKVEILSDGAEVHTFDYGTSMAEDPTSRFSYSYNDNTDIYTTREIVITLKDGTTLEHLTFSATLGAIYYSFGDYFYSSLSDETLSIFNSRFGIN